uniref:(northern house mosquito) hypothetical protein n=1 Tax=Culex pipiens TaxID=7175 RepID=A0A8D8BLE7_CULPI
MWQQTRQREQGCAAGCKFPFRTGYSRNCTDGTIFTATSAAYSTGAIGSESGHALSPRGSVNSAEEMIDSTGSPMKIEFDPKILEEKKCSTCFLQPKQNKKDSSKLSFEKQALSTKAPLAVNPESVNHAV